MRCPKCFREIGASNYCPSCHLNMWEEAELRRKKKALPILYVLANRYELGVLLGAGGFGITYLARDIMNHQLVAVKEFFPTELCDRAQNGSVVPQRNKQAFERSVDHFYNEAKTLHKLDRCQSVANVDGFLRANETAYIVMEYVRGESLKQYMQRSGNTIPYDKAKEIVVMIALALGEVHRVGIVHSDISPSNILIEPDGDVKLIDFGASRSYLNENDSSLTVQLKPGFAALEQYAGSGLKLGPWTDFYALACTFYRMVTGRMPPPAMERQGGAEVTPLSELVPETEACVEKAIQKAMELNYHERCQSADEFIADVMGYGQVIADPPERGDGEGSGTTMLDPPEENFLSRLIRKLNIGRKRTTNDGNGHTEKQNTAYVEVRQGKNAGTRLQLSDGRQYLIGRQSGICDLVVSDEQVISRVHCTLRFDAAEKYVEVTDKSRNGTMLENGQILHEESFLIRNDCILLLSRGEVILQIIFGEE